MKDRKIILEKITYEEITLEEFMKKHPWLEKYGDYNTMPEPCRTIHPEEFIARIGTPEYMEYRQVKLPAYPFVVGVHIYWYRREAFAVTKPSGKHAPRFYRIGCEHDFRLQPGGYVDEHTYKCSKCGYTEVQDSSG